MRLKLILCMLVLVMLAMPSVADEVGDLIVDLKDKDWVVRGIAVQSLGDIGDSRAIVPLIKALKDEHRFVREAAAVALGKIGDARAVDPLIAVLDDEDGYVRMSAAEALGEIGDPRAFDSLTEALKDDRSVVREAATTALDKIVGPQEPVPPRTGQYSVQLIIGDTDDVVLNIIPPRLYTDGTPIPKGTPCTIIIYMSKATGAPGTYIEEVGRAEGAVTAPNDLQAWMVVKANAGPDDPLNDVIYLACTAVIGGVESAQNNQWLTINWHPQGIPEWDVVEFPGVSGATAGEILPCSNYWGPIEPTGVDAAGPRQSPGSHMLVYAEVPKSSDPSQSLPANWNWKTYGPVDLKGGKRYFLVFGRSSDPELFEEQNLPFSETQVTATKDMAIIWDSNKATSDVRYAYCFTSMPVSSLPGSSSDSSNLALHKLASQSSTATDWGGNWDASRGVDGVKTGNIFDGGFHTDSETSPWWQVDLGAMHDLDYALLYNRQDCCGERAESLEVLLSDDGQSWQSMYKHDGSIFGGADGHPLKVDLNGQKARFLRVQLLETNWLHLDEVEVFGCQ